jgi:integrase
MSVSRLPSGRWRSQTYDSATGKFVSSAKVLGLTEPTFATETKARRADAAAAKVLAERRGLQLTVAEWARRGRRTRSTGAARRARTSTTEERIRRFVDEHGSLPLAAVDDQIVSQWIAGGRNLSTVPVLKAMFNDAASAKAGRLVKTNPFAGLRLAKGKGRAEEDPPSEEQVAVMLEHAARVTVPGFNAWLRVACWTGMRPGELDALQWPRVDFAANRIHVLEQWNVKERAFGLPKNGKTRVILLTPQAREALLAHQNGLRWCFENSRGNHWTPSARSHHWDRVRALMGWLDVDSRKAIYSRRDTSPAGTSTTCWSSPPRMWRSSSGMRTAASS